jgi:hypothetical protein
MGNSADIKQILLKDIRAKWSKFFKTELGALKYQERSCHPHGRQAQL